MDAVGWDERYAAEERVFSAEPNPFVAELAGSLAPGRALDLAAGEGRHALWLARRGWRVTAVDFSRVGLDKGRRWAQEENLAIDWVLADVLAYEPPPGAFDLVLVIQFHPDPDDRERFFAWAAEALRPGGRLLAIGRHADDVGRDGGRGPRDRERRYTPVRLRAALPATLAPLLVEARTRWIAADDEPTELTDVIAWAERTGG